jgi:hypothetical protein
MSSDNDTVATEVLDEIVRTRRIPPRARASNRELAPDPANNADNSNRSDSGQLQADEIANMPPPEDGGEQDWLDEEVSSNVSLPDRPPSPPGAGEMGSVANSAAENANEEEGYVSDVTEDEEMADGENVTLDQNVIDFGVLLSENEFDQALLNPNNDFEATATQENDDTDLSDMIGTFEIRDRVRVSPNAYIDNLEATSGLHIRHPRTVINAVTEGENKNNPAYGLFKLYFPFQLLRLLAQWTTKRLQSKQRRKTNITELKAYMGLEIGLALNGASTISECWNQESFSGNEWFNQTMSRDRFLNIRGSICLHDPDLFDLEANRRDPLWHSRWFLDQMADRCARLAVPVGVSTLDECGYRSKARCSAISYLPSKPDKYAIRFYAIVCWLTLYLHTFEHNGTGVNLNEKAVDLYLKRFPMLRQAYARVFLNDGGVAKRFGVDKLSSTALWTLMIQLQETLSRANEDHKRIIICDNFYTRHSFASVLKTITDGRVRIIGTVRGNFLGIYNAANVKAAMQRLANAPRGSWILVRAYDPPTTRNGEKTVADSAGFIVFKDSKVCVFYSNDLAFTPSQDFLEMESQEAINCCHGLATCERWLGPEHGHRTQLKVPAPIVAYNKYMNAVDRMDQMRSTNPTCRKEKRVPMTLFTGMIDVAINNAFALYNVLRTH